ncbi:fimbrial protein [Serratia marcescens]|uniref:fimbrial protein n=2 Tax=Serratia marcescens TaxID=615 RepID=UPI0039EB484B
MAAAFFIPWGVLSAAVIQVKKQFVNKKWCFLLTQEINVMKTSISKLAVVAVLGLTSLGASAAGNSGKVTFSGEVVDAPCNLAPGQDGTDIKVPFGQLSMSQLNAGHVAAQKFDIQLQDCDLAGKTAQITFTGTTLSGSTTLLETQGGATGLGIGLSGITFGTAKPLTGLKDTGNNTLTYTATAQRAVAGTDVTAGDFAAITNFQISYQ